ncbi:MAG: precorrin-3B C(17)-methyltransferase [Hormoscilla sp. GUM202]|nr:precorrin-3B C(17)-methyltransferase [Hormoscilla sp. GUM202]
MTKRESEFQPLAAIAVTPTAVFRLQLALSTKVLTTNPEDFSTKVLTTNKTTNIWVPASLDNIPGTRVYQGSLKEHLATLWSNHRALIFCLATGAVVRLIAPLLKDKSRDPAVIVIDEGGKFVISLCSGHQGGADKLAKLIAQQLGATPILTGASAALQLPGVDMLGVPFGWQRGPGDWTEVSAAVVRIEPVQVMQEVGTTLWQKHLPEGHQFSFHLDNDKISPKGRICVTHRQLSPESDIPQAQWHPRVLWVGIGCERGTSRRLIERAITEVMQAHGLAEGAIAGVATIDLKADELAELCRDRLFPLRSFPAEMLRSVTVPTPSNVVEKAVGTPSVAEAAALLAAGAEPEASLLVAKQIFRTAGELGAVTVAIARAAVEYTGRTGKLLLVGIGPGQLDQITPAAQTAIVSADALVGYSLYIDLIAPLLRPGQIVEAFPITRERQRGERAIELANWGLTVAVISSGDCGIYGMAGLVMEQLRSSGWDGEIPIVEVLPGITAMQAAAAKVGAPLMHDFCAISLSDLLTPWEVIEKRLHAAAQADFVTALYNPKSANRTRQIVTAQQIFLQYRKPDTPVAIVRSVYRESEQITLTTLDKFLSIPIDMLTTMLIGNQSTQTHGDWMITPRGYLSQSP